MNVVYPICCGVDVHKTFFVATIITTVGIQPIYQKRRFSTFNNQILTFKAWLLENNCRDVCMESTGKYWVPVYNLLEDSINVTIANPRWVKAVKGNKDDYQGLQVDRRPVSYRAGAGQLHSLQGCPHPAGVYAVSIQAGIL